MKFTKAYLNETLRNGDYEKLVENNLHSGTHFTMIFRKMECGEPDRFYQAYFIEDINGDPRWLSEKNSTDVNCDEVICREEKITHVYYESVDNEILSTTPLDLDYRL